MGDRTPKPIAAPAEDARTSHALPLSDGVAAARNAVSLQHLPSGWPRLGDPPLAGAIQRWQLATVQREAGNRAAASCAVPHRSLQRDVLDDVKPGDKKKQLFFEHPLKLGKFKKGKLNWNGEGALVVRAFLSHPGSAASPSTHEGSNKGLAIKLAEKVGDWRKDAEGKVIHRNPPWGPSLDSFEIEGEFAGGGSAEKATATALGVGAKLKGRLASPFGDGVFLPWEAKGILYLAKATVPVNGSQPSETGQSDFDLKLFPFEVSGELAIALAAAGFTKALAPLDIAGSLGLKYKFGVELDKSDLVQDILLAIAKKGGKEALERRFGSELPKLLARQAAGKSLKMSWRLLGVGALLAQVVIESMAASFEDISRAKNVYRDYEAARDGFASGYVGAFGLRGGAPSGRMAGVTNLAAGIGAGGRALSGAIEKGMGSPEAAKWGFTADDLRSEMLLLVVDRQDELRQAVYQRTDLAMKHKYLSAWESMLTPMDHLFGNVKGQRRALRTMFGLPEDGPLPVPPPPDAPQPAKGHEEPAPDETFAPQSDMPVA